MAALRHPERGCPWDLEQTFATIAPYTIEEAYEVADAIQRDDLDDLLSELGDLLLQVVYHARIAEERGRFAFADVAHAIATKMVARHPHVFGDAGSRTTEELRGWWEAAKAEERAAKARRADHADASALADVPLALPALTRAVKLQRRAARVGFDWRDAAGALEKVKEEADELVAAADPEEQKAELGDLLFTLVNVARHLGIDPETALRGTNARFERRFRAMERAAATEGSELAGLDPEALDRLWRAAKRADGGA